MARLKSCPDTVCSRPSFNPSAEKIRALTTFMQFIGRQMRKDKLLDASGSILSISGAETSRFKAP
jgi:hypothetical protein